MSTKVEALSDKEYIERFCGGDERLFNVSMIEGRKDRIVWDDLVVSNQVLTNYSEAACDLIKKQLGYLPAAAIYTPHETFIRALLAEARGQDLTDETLLNSVQAHIKHIRNDDVRKSGFELTICPKPQDIERYQTHLRPYKQLAQDRVRLFFGEMLPLGYTLQAEFLLRDAMARGQDLTDASLSAVDMRAFTIVAYLRDLDRHGRDAANASPLLPSLKY